MIDSPWFEYVVVLPLLFSAVAFVAGVIVGGGAAYGFQRDERRQHVRG